VHDRRIRLGIIGTGIAARELHWPPLERSRDHFEIVAVCNRTREKAETFAGLVGGAPRITTDYRELLSWPEVDAVDIVLPIVMNAPVTIEALRADKHVMVEKPIAGDLQSARAVVEEARMRPHRVLLVAENVRYERRYREARRLIDEGRIGRTVMFHADIFDPLDAGSPYLGTGWRRRPEHLGGFLSDGGVHHVAALQCLAGRVRAVQGLVTSFDPQHDPSDTLVANLQFVSGAVGHLTYSVGVRQGENASLRVDGTQGLLLIFHDRLVVRVGDEEETMLVPGEPSGYDLELADFYQSIVEGKGPEVGAQEGYDDLQVIDAVFQSSREGRAIPLR